MTQPPAPPANQKSARLSAEKVAYWYFRLNGFLQIENFVVHPKLYGGQRTDADLIGVRFPYRAERLFDDTTDVMEDDVGRLDLAEDRTDVVIAEIKSGRCALNGPWTNSEGQNIHRVLAAIGCLPPDEIERAAQALYDHALFDEPPFPRVRLILVGREPDHDIAKKFHGIVQITWDDVASFIWCRFDRYERQKTQIDQWDPVGRKLKSLASELDQGDFITQLRKGIGIRDQIAGPVE